MTQITGTGRELAKPILRALGATYGSELALGVEMTCSLIARSGPTYKRLQEKACNDPMDDVDLKRHEAAEGRCEQAVTAHCERLSKLTGHLIAPQFHGDPRGYTLRLRYDAAFDVGVPGS